MGLRFSLRHANLLANMLKHTGTRPVQADQTEVGDAIKEFISSFECNFFSSGDNKKIVSDAAKYQLERLKHSRIETDKAIELMSSIFSNIPWVALLLPSGSHFESDDLLMSRRFLKEIVNYHPDDNGLILQLADMDRGDITLEDVFPSLKKAISNYTRWPGLLVWTPSGQAEFFELTENRNEIRNRLHWIFGQLSTPRTRLRLCEIYRRFIKSFNIQNTLEEQVKILHMSDLHLGTTEARKKMTRVKALIESVVKELGNPSKIVPVISGDLMDSPSQESLGEVLDFMQHFKYLGVKDPIFVLGNHDVRTSGWLGTEALKALSLRSQAVAWLDEEKLAIACLNSVNGGHFARGMVGEQELQIIGNALDSQPKKNKQYMVLATLHHHLNTIPHPNWYKKRWYERIFGRFFNSAECLIDADSVSTWINSRNIPIVLHGHKHIPYFKQDKGFCTIGCGSTFGMVNTVDSKKTYMSMNIITIDRSNGTISCRLRAEQILGGGLKSVESHEIVCRENFFTPD